MNIKKILAGLMALAMTSIAVAQNGYSIEIKQVLPRNAVVYSNVFDFKRKMDEALSNQTAKLQDSDGNYQIHIVTSSTNEVRTIQNINWVVSVNGKLSYHKKKTQPAKSYNSPTIWEGYSCDLYGKRKGKVDRREFVYRVSRAGSPGKYETAFVDRETANSEVDRIAKASVSDGSQADLMIYKFGKDTTLVYNSAKTLQENLDNSQAKETHVEKTEEKSPSIQDQIEGFESKMNYIHRHRDSLRIIGVYDCRKALENASNIPDSLFLSHRLDSLYRVVLLDDILQTKDKAIRKSLEKVEYQRKLIGDKKLIYDVKTPAGFLLKYTKEIENALGPQKKTKNNPQK